MPDTRIKLSFADVWADPHAGWNACIDIWCMPLEDLAPEQRAAALVWRYSGEINNGGHLQYFSNLHDGVEAIVPETIAAWRTLGCGDYADILAEAFRRWTGVARLRPAGLAKYSAVAQEREFDDLDDAFYKIDIKPNGGDGSWHVLERHFREQPDR